MTITDIPNTSFPSPSESDWTLTERLNSLYVLALEQKKKYQADWRINYLLTNNRQYASETQQPWSPNVTDSEIFPILSSRVAWMTDQRITPLISPASTAGEKFTMHYQKLSDDLCALLETAAKLEHWNAQVLLILWDAALCGAGIVKSCWDSGLVGGEGNIDMRRVDIWNFYPDPNATSFKDCSYMFEVKKMSIDEIERRFPSADITTIKQAALYGDRSDDSPTPTPATTGRYPMAAPGNLPNSSSTVWGLPGQSGRSTDSILSEGITVKEAWVRENHRFTRDPTDWSSSPPPDSETVVTDDWRCIVYTGNTVLMDEYAIDLWETNRHPYSRYVDEEMGEFFPTPIVSHLRPCQIAVNRLLSSIQSNVELTGNPVFMDVANSGISRTQITNRPGIRVQMASQVANSQGAKPSWLPPPQMSADAWKGVEFWIGRMENISGLSGVSKGQAPAGRPAQQTVQSTQEAGFVRIRQSLRNLEATISEQYTLLANLAVLNYDTPRVMATIGDDGASAAIRFAARHFYTPSPNGAQPMKFSIQVTAGSSNPTSRQARIAEADALFSMHAIDRTALLMVHAFPHWQDINQRMQQAEQAQQQLEIAMAMNKQQPHGPGTGHEH